MKRKTISLVNTAIQLLLIKNIGNKLSCGKKILYVILFLIFDFSSLISFSQPTITSFTPTSGIIGTTVTISGTNFNTTPANNRVFFGAAMATVSVATATSLTVTVPIAANYGYITVTNLGTNLTAYSTQPFQITFTCPGTLSFSPKVDFATGAGNGWPFTVALADLDGDGKPDLATANYNENTFSTLGNTSTPGTISFTASTNYATNTQPNDVALGDIDGDGLLDAVTTATSATKASPYRNTSTPGNISFAAKTDQSAGTQPYSAKIIDFDGDGKPDIVTANCGGNNVSVLLSNSTGPNSFNFAAPVNFATGTYPAKLAVGDLDGDGKPEIISSNFTNSNISVLRNTCTPGTASFAATVNYATGANPEYIAIGDLNADGKPELAVANRNTNNVLIFKNNCTPGTISFSAGVGFGTGTYPYGVAIGDIDGDGLPDLAIANYTSKSVSTLKNTSASGSISFAPKVDYTIVQAVGNTCGFGVVIGDIDGDGMPDIVATNECGSNVSALLNQCGTLPIELLSFTGHNEVIKNILKWTTASENNNEYFSIERSKDETGFEKIGSVPGAGSSSSTLSYSFTDANPYQGINYYRLKQVDFNGNSTYSQIIALMVGQPNHLAINVYPNPASTVLNCELYSKEEEPVVIEVHDILGNVVIREEIKTVKGTNAKNLDISSLAQGMYFMEINNRAKQTQVKFVKQ